MPYADPEKKRASAKVWREKKIKQGYGKALYARRKQHYQNEITLREHLEAALAAALRGDLQKCIALLKHGLESAPEVKARPLDFMPQKEGK